MKNLIPLPIITDRRLREALHRADGEVAGRLVELACKQGQDHSDIHRLTQEMVLCHAAQVDDRPASDLWAVAWRLANGAVFFSLRDEVRP